ncbi:hypothetical protein BT96DRAFT_58720 [Gymnopus androsaceus JB14]|uniref:Uncharacterized protein n=1 Tax=Gymnopus androsaceus JB14 TaxID=1447944 RepID=A0A6A4IFX5_9AGAR|nr:hypothetical protein BT96DRAFT_58720 [Gymnopus androsaceus JB14]
MHFSHWSSSSASPPPSSVPLGYCCSPVDSLRPPRKIAQCYQSTQTKRNFDTHQLVQAFHHPLQGKYLINIPFAPPRRLAQCRQPTRNKHTPQLSQTFQLEYIINFHISLPRRLLYYRQPTRSKQIFDTLQLSQTFQPLQGKYIISSHISQPRRLAQCRHPTRSSRTFDIHQLTQKGLPLILGDLHSRSPGRPQSCLPSLQGKQITEAQLALGVWLSQTCHHPSLQT